MAEQRWVAFFRLAVMVPCGLLLSLPGHASQRFAGSGELEVAFTPRDNGQEVLLRFIAEARRSLLVQAFVFTSKPIAAALVKAHQRGVKVEVLADAQMNRRAQGNAVPVLLAGGVPVAFETAYRAAHNKVLIRDAEGPGCGVLTGSYNFTWSAQNRNAENILIVRGHCELARAYRDNWQRHRAEAKTVRRLPFKP